MAHENPWEGLEGPGYRLKNLGRPAVFFVPVRSFTRAMRTNLEQVLARKFGAFTFDDVPNHGMWQGADGTFVEDRSVRYTVSFVGKERIPELCELLATLAGVLDERSIYLEAGQYACEVVPT